MLEKLQDWKDFERLCADLLEAEGFEVESEPSLDRTGIDIRATEEYRSHASRAIRIRWRVQCKHYAGSGRKLGRKEVEECLTSYQAAREHDEGLFLIVSTEYTEAAKDLVDKFTRLHPEARVTLWNERQITAKLDRHPRLLRRYAILPPSSDFLTLFTELQSFTTGDVLFISDQSLFAHQLTNALGHAGFNVIYLPFWNYIDSRKLKILMSSIDRDSLALIVCFLGDSFSIRLPSVILDFLRIEHNSGTPLLLFPFLAWSIEHGMYPELRDVSPVTLLDPTEAADTYEEYQILGEFRRGDFRWLLAFDSFAEDRYVEYDPLTTSHGIAAGIKRRFGISHSFEYLRSANGGKVIWADSSGNPFVIVDEDHGGRICYINSCCHGCLSNIPISSPMEASLEFSQVICNAIAWLLSNGNTPN